MKQSIKKGIDVVILAGKDKGKTGKVARVLGDRVVVEGQNLQTHHEKQRQSGRGLKQGGIVQKPSPIHRSNLKIVSE